MIYCIILCFSCIIKLSIEILLHFFFKSPVIRISKIFVNYLCRFVETTINKCFKIFKLTPGLVRDDYLNLAPLIFCVFRIKKKYFCNHFFFVNTVTCQLGYERRKKTFCYSKIIFISFRLFFFNC